MKIEDNMNNDKGFFMNKKGKLKVKSIHQTTRFIVIAFPSNKIPMFVLTDSITP